MLALVMILFISSIIECFDEIQNIRQNNETWSPSLGGQPICKIICHCKVSPTINFIMYVPFKLDPTTNDCILLLLCRMETIPAHRKNALLYQYANQVNTLPLLTAVTLAHVSPCTCIYCCKTAKDYSHAHFMMHYSTVTSFSERQRSSS